MHFISTPADLKRQFPLHPAQRNFIADMRRQACEIMQGKDKRLAVIVGPCSIHDLDAALDYAERLKRLSIEVESSALIVMRLFCEKARTKFGWKGLLYDPDLDGTNDVEKGLRLSRQLLISLASLGVPCATEFLDPLASHYFSDLITWGFIGARTSASQPHRQMASSFSFPVGFKNSILGEIEPALYGVLTSRAPHSYLGIDEYGRISSLRGKGNPYTHLVLRGAEERPNFDPLSVQKALAELRSHHLEPRLLIDCAHGNCGKDLARQKLAFESVLAQIREDRRHIIGLMLESHLAQGKQPHFEDLNQLRYGISITDPCLGWEETEELILAACCPTTINSSTL